MLQHFRIALYCSNFLINLRIVKKSLLFLFFFWYFPLNITGIFQLRYNSIISFNFFPSCSSPAGSQWTCSQNAHPAALSFYYLWQNSECTGDIFFSQTLSFFCHDSDTMLKILMILYNFIFALNNSSDTYTIPSLLASITVFLNF